MVACRLENRPFQPTMICTLETARGPVHFHSPARAEAVAGLHIDPGIGAFWHYRDGTRQKNTLLKAILAGGSVTLAVSGEFIIGYLIVAPPAVGERWAGVPGVYETSIEVSRDWRNLGLAHWLMRFIFTDSRWEHRIVVAQGYHWHWDLAHAGVEASEYRERLRRFHEAHGFGEFGTDDPEIAESADNILLARIGQRSAPSLRRAFYEQLYMLRRAPAWVEAMRQGKAA